MHFTGANFRPRFDVVRTQKLISSHGGFLACVMHHHRENITYHNETKKRALDFLHFRTIFNNSLTCSRKVVKAKENLKLSDNGPSHRQASGTNPTIRVVIKSEVRPTVVQLSNRTYTMGCPPVRGDNPRALASALSYVQWTNMV